MGDNLYHGRVETDNAPVKSRSLRLTSEGHTMVTCMNALDKLDHDQTIRVCNFLMQRYAFAKAPQDDSHPR